MRKEGDLWDDFALINAFDNAMSKYKKMHNIGCSSAGKNIISCTDGDVNAADDDSYVPTRDGEEDNVLALNADPPTPPPVEENDYLNSNVPESFVNSSDTEQATDASEGHQYSQKTEEYNQLISQYYEIEEKRQKILEKLEQVSGWNYQYSGQYSGAGAQGVTYPASQAYPTAVSYCCPYDTQCHQVAPCSSYPATCAGYKCTNNSDVDKSLPLGDVDIVKTAMRAAEKAVCSTKLKSSANMNKTAEEIEKMVPDTGSETDLTVVLKSWYTAGFYTGKYLTEQSTAKKGTDKNPSA